jgi:hypothetical protein
MKKNLILLLSIMITFFVIPCFAQKTIKLNNKNTTYINFDGKIISHNEFSKISKGGKYTYSITDLGNGKKEVRLVKKDNSEISFNTKDAIFKDIDGKIISSEESSKMFKGGKYTYTITDLGNGKKEVRLVKKDSGKSTIK